MEDKQLHIVSFDVPYPPNYGGIIDVFYKIKALSDAGIRITLHAFYKGSSDYPFEMDEYCDKIFLYSRNMTWRKAAGTTPFILASRDNDQMINRLRADNAPILLEGMHTASLLRHSIFRRRKILVRMHNIEWDYYSGLARQESGFLRRCYYLTESWRLKLNAGILRKAERLLAISEYEFEKLSQQFDHCSYLPPFHGHESVTAKTGTGEYALYHGNLQVVENRKAVEFLIDNVFEGLDYPLKIAGSKAPESWIRKWDNRAEFIFNPSDEKLNELIHNAQINILVSFQNTGVKLKLIHALFKGRHCIVNHNMVENSNLKTLCHVADTADGLKQLILEIAQKPFENSEVEKRNLVLAEEFNNQVNAAHLIEWLYPHP